LAIWFFLNRTKFGKAIGAVTQDSVAARLMGVDTDLIHIAVFGISGAAAAVAGGLMLPITMVYPTVGFENALLMSFIIVIIGGLGEVKGIIFVGITIGIIESIVTTFLLSEYATLVSFAILITVLVLKPEGLFGRRE
jgi:branched-chain amino acid transport system permease protein